jgi:hypothetical protein
MFAFIFYTVDPNTRHRPTGRCRVLLTAFRCFEFRLIRPEAKQLNKDRDHLLWCLHRLVAIYEVEGHYDLSCLSRRQPSLTSGVFEPSNMWDWAA